MSDELVPVRFEVEMSVTKLGPSVTQYGHPESERLMTFQLEAESGKAASVFQDALQQLTAPTLQVKA